MWRIIMGNENEQILENEQVLTDAEPRTTYSLDDLFYDETEDANNTDSNKEEVSSDDIDNDVKTGSIPVYVPQYDYQKEFVDKIDSFVEEAWDPQTHGLTLPWDKMDKALNGLQVGLHIIAGESNHGKSALLSCIEVGLINSNPDSVYILSHSLDDTFQDKLARMAAIMSDSTINFIKTPLRSNITQDINDPWYLKWQSAILKVKKASAMLNIKDSTEGGEVETIIERAKETKKMLEELAASTGIRRQLVLTIDSFHDLTSKNTSIMKDENIRWEYLAKTLSDASDALKIPIICTGELIKNGQNRPNIQDIRGASKLRFKAKSILLVYNEVSAKNEGASIYYTLNGQNDKRPVLEVHYAKNKFSPFKGRHYFMFQPEKVRLIMATDESERKYNSKIYG